MLQAVVLGLVYHGTWITRFNARSANVDTHDEDVLLRKLAEHPETRAKIRAMLATPPPANLPPPAPVPAPPVAQPAHTPAPLQTGVTMPDAKPPAPVSVVMVSPVKPLRASADTIPDGVTWDNKLRTMLAEAEFQKASVPSLREAAFP